MHSSPAVTTYIIGPSHVLSWLHSVERRALASPFPATEYIAGSGLPIWNATAFQVAQSVVRPGDRVLIVVGEVRHGNSVLHEPDHAEGPVFRDGHDSVTAAVMDETRDRLMYLRFREALRQWQARFGDQLIILHWSLLTRPLINRMQNRYVDEKGVYRHPIWNLSDFMNPPDAATVDLRAAESAPHGRLMSLIVDQNLHPSPVGFDVIAALAGGAAFPDALDKAWQQALDRTNRWISVAGSAAAPTLICGDSYFIQIAHAMLTGQERAALAAAGLHLAVEGTIEGLQRHVLDHAIREVLFVTQAGAHQADYRDSDIGILPSIFRLSAATPRLRVLPWETIAREITAARGEFGGMTRNAAGAVTSWLMQRVIASVDLCADARVLRDPEADGCVDIGSVCRPTLRGLYAVLAAAATGGAFSPGASAAWTDHAIFGPATEKTRAVASAG